MQQTSAGSQAHHQSSCSLVDIISLDYVFNTEKKPVFELSEAGRTYVAEHAEELEQGWRGVAGMSESASGLRESAMQFMGVMQQFRLGATEEQQQEATKVLDDARKALYAILAK